MSLAAWVIDVAHLPHVCPQLEIYIVFNRKMHSFSLEIDFLIQLIEICNRRQA